jgi:hypothetical protein
MMQNLHPASRNIEGNDIYSSNDYNPQRNTLSYAAASIVLTYALSNKSAKVGHLGYMM